MTSVWKVKFFSVWVLLNHFLEILELLSVEFVEFGEMFLVK